MAPHTNGIESFWATLKRAHKGVYHKISVKHLQRYVDEFAGRHGVRELDTLDQMEIIAGMMAGKRLKLSGVDRQLGVHAFAFQACTERP